MPPIPFAPAGREDVVRLAELQMLADAGMPNDWAKSVEDFFSAKGNHTGYSLSTWQRTPWYGPIDTYMRRGKDITDILIDGDGLPISVVTRGILSDTGVVPHPSWTAFVQRQLLLRSQTTAPQQEQLDDWRDEKHRPTHRVDGSCDRRFRYCITRAPLTPDGPTVAVRVIPEAWSTITDLVHESAQILTREAVSFLLDAIRHGVTVLISGVTGSGKSTIGAALLQAIGDEKRTIIIEQARELPKPRMGFSMEVGGSGGLSFAACVYAALRMRPDMIVVGEVRGAEALAMLQAAATGHAGIATIHGGTPKVALSNLERMACEAGEIPPTSVRGMIASAAIPMLVMQVVRAGGRRRVTEIAEVIPAGASGKLGDEFPTNPIFATNAAGALARSGSVSAAWGKGRY